MFKEKMKQFGLIGDSFDELVEKELRSPLTRFYFNLSLAPQTNRSVLLDGLDKYTQLSLSKTTRTPEFDRFETGLELNVFHVLNGRSYTEGDTLTFAKQAIQEYSSLPDNKKALFRESLLPVSRKEKNFSPVLKQKTKA